jgi:gas vesicle protein
MQNRIYYSRDAEMIAQRNRLLLALVAALLGGSIGAIVALLFAEQRGEEIRGNIADSSESTFRKVREGVEHLAKDVQRTVEHATR